ncbi:hypothetical protein AWT69_000569 [Pseudomonas putida]|nr:hypothetical protein AWT69_000569 [Pseudomonas putida]
MLLEYFFGWHYNFSALCSEQGPCQWFCLPGKHTTGGEQRRPAAFSLLSVQPSTAEQALPTHLDKEQPSSAIIATLASVNVQPTCNSGRHRTAHRWCVTATGSTV